ncbi:MAG: helix-turn-helix transcriptional regulator [Gemmobacter sp.]
MTDTLQLLGRIAGADCVDAVWAPASAYFADLGFRRLNYGLTRFRTERSIGDPDDALFLSTSDPDYARLYFRGGFYLKTPIYRWALRSTGVTTWRWVQEEFTAGRLSRDEAEAVRVNDRFGIVAGLAISFPEMAGRTKGALGMAADPDLTHDDVDRIWASDGSAIMAVAQMMHLRIASLPAAHVRRDLTVRQREALEWVADGKTTADVAVILGVSTAMVEKHLRLAREALNVDTTAQAVAKGTLLNLIFVRPDAAGMDSLTVLPPRKVAI